jgi:hypothetical protein
MMSSVVKNDFWKLVSSVMVSSLLALWSMMSAVGEATRVGAEVRPEVVKTVEWVRGSLCEMLLV